MRITERNGWIRFDVRVLPRASRNEFAGVQDGALKVRLQAPPVEGAANEALLRFLADELDLSPRQVRLVSGLGSRSKVVEIEASGRKALDRIASAT